MFSITYDMEPVIPLKLILLSVQKKQFKKLKKIKTGKVIP